MAKFFVFGLPLVKFLQYISQLLQALLQLLLSLLHGFRFNLLWQKTFSLTDQSLRFFHRILHAMHTGPSNGLRFAVGLEQAGDQALPAAFGLGDQEVQERLVAFPAQLGHFGQSLQIEAIRTAARCAAIQVVSDEEQQTQEAF